MNKNPPVIVAGAGFIVLFLGIICSWYAFPRIVDYAIKQRIALEEGTEVYEIWRKQPFPLKFKVYFFNVTNADDVQQGSNPIIKEVGPYVYDEYWERVNVSIDNENDTISYMLKRSFFFNQTESVCRMEDDMITMINGALVSTANQVYNILPAAVATINDAIPYLYKGAKDVFIRATAKDILFGGILITCHDEEVEFICGAMKGMLPPTLEFAENGMDFKFSLFGYMNNTLAGPFVIGRGIKNTTRGNIYAFKGAGDASVWPGRACNMFNGSDTTLFYPMKTPPKRIHAFSPDICRAMFVSYEKEVVIDGIPTWKYENKPESISNTKENECFCPVVKDEDFKDVIKCPRSGLVDLTYCLKAPIFISNPHFYLGDPSLVDYVQGVKPKKELHENFMYIEPTTASPVWGAKRLQMNVELKKYADFDLLNNVSEGVFPMVWIEEVFGVVIPPEFKRQILTGLSQLGIVDIVKWVVILCGIFLMITSFILVMYKERLVCFAGIASTNKVNITEVKASNRQSFTHPPMDVNINGARRPSRPLQLYPHDNMNHRRLAHRDSTNSLSNAFQNMN